MAKANIALVALITLCLAAALAGCSSTTAADNQKIAAHTDHGQAPEAISSASSGLAGDSNRENPDGNASISPTDNPTDNPTGSQVDSQSENTPEASPAMPSEQPRESSGTPSGEMDQHMDANNTANAENTGSDQAVSEPTAATPSDPAGDSRDDGAPSEPADGTPESAYSQNPDEYFNNSVFVGDSITEGLAQYVRGKRSSEPTLGDAKFLSTVNGIKLADCAGDMGADTVYYFYMGSEKPFDQCISEMGVSKVFIMLGMNDLELGHSIADTISRYERTILKVYDAVPGAEVVVMLLTPKIASDWLPWYCINPDFGNGMIDEFNEETKQMCYRMGLKYIDLNSALKGGNNALPDSLCGDGFVHLNPSGLRIVVDTLRAFAQSAAS